MHLQTPSHRGSCWHCKACTSLSVTDCDIACWKTVNNVCVLHSWLIYIGATIAAGNHNIVMGISQPIHKLQQHYFVWLSQHEHEMSIPWCSEQASLARQDLCHTHLALLLESAIILVIIQQAAVNSLCKDTQCKDNLDVKHDAMGNQPLQSDWSGPSE